MQEGWETLGWMYRPWLNSQKQYYIVTFPQTFLMNHLDHVSVEPLLAKRKGGRDGMYWPRLLPGTVRPTALSVSKSPWHTDAV